MKKRTHQERYVARQKGNKGLIQVTVWVPSNDREALLTQAKGYRDADRKR